MSDPKFNPQTLSWTAPRENADGTPITYELDYVLGVLDEGVGDLVDVMTLPATLNPNGRYQAPISDMGLESGRHTIALKSVAREDDSRASEWSQTVSFFISEQVPSAPLALQVS